MDFGASSGVMTAPVNSALTLSEADGLDTPPLGLSLDGGGELLCARGLCLAAARQFMVSLDLHSSASSRPARCEID